MALNIPNNIPNNRRHFIPEKDMPPSRKNNKNNHSFHPAELKSALQQTKPNGLLVGNRLIKRISGPASVTLLKPPANPPFLMPPVIFFGDVHFSVHGECEQCDGRDGCYRISNGSFYQVFDRVATKDAPIDVYVESFMKDMPYHEPFPQKGEMARTRDFIRKCAAWNKIEQKREQTPSCPTRNIRYQYSDPRQAHPVQVKGTTFEYLLDMMHNSPVHTKEYILKSSDPLTQEIGKQIIKAFEGFKGITKERKPINLEEYTFEMYELIKAASPEHSRIAKQLQKMPNAFNKEWLLEVIHDAIRKLHLNDWYLNTWMADVYTILRLFKTSKDGISPALAIMYFGNYHRQVIVNFLIKRLGYEAIYSDEQINENKLEPNNRNLTARCVIFNKHIPLTNLFQNPVLAQGKRRRSRKHRGPSLGITLDQVDGPIRRYGNFIFYVFHLPRNDKRVMTVDRITIDEFQEERMTENQREKHISTFPIQTLILYYHPKKKQHHQLHIDYRTTEENNDMDIPSMIYSDHIRPILKEDNKPFIYDFVMMMLETRQHHYYLTYRHDNGNNENSDDSGNFPFGEGSNEGIEEILFTLTPDAVHQIRKMIMDHPMTPRDALIYSHNGGRRRSRPTKKKIDFWFF